MLSTSVSCAASSRHWAAARRSIRRCDPCADLYHRQRKLSRCRRCTDRCQQHTDPGLERYHQPHGPGGQNTQDIGKLQQGGGGGGGGGKDSGNKDEDSGNKGEDSGNKGKGSGNIGWGVRNG